MPPQTSQNDTKWWYTRAKWVTRLNQICIQKKTRAKNTKWWYTRTKWSLQVVYRVNMLESKAHEMMIYTHKKRFTNGWPGQHVGEQNELDDDIHAQKKVYKWLTGSTCWRAKRTKWWYTRTKKGLQMDLAKKNMPGCAHLPNELPYIYIYYILFVCIYNVGRLLKIWNWESHYLQSI